MCGSSSCISPAYYVSQIFFKKKYERHLQCQYLLKWIGHLQVYLNGSRGVCVCLSVCLDQVLVICSDCYHQEYFKTKLFWAKIHFKKFILQILFPEFPSHTPMNTFGKICFFLENLLNFKWWCFIQAWEKLKHRREGSVVAWSWKECEKSSYFSVDANAELGGAVAGRRDRWSPQRQAASYLGSPLTRPLPPPTAPLCAEGVEEGFVFIRVWGGLCNAGRGGP